MNSVSIRQNRFSQNPKEAAFYENPYALYAQLHNHGGPAFWEDYGFWCLGGFDAVNNALRDKRFARLPPAGCERPAYPPHLSDFAATEKWSLLGLEPPDHTHVRQCVNRAFVSRSVNAMENDIRTLAHERIDAFAGEGSTELLGNYASDIPVTVIARLLGVPESYCDDLLAWSHAMVKVYTMTQTHEEELAANTAARDFTALLKDLVAQRRRQPQADLLSHMTGLDSAKALHDDAIICTAILLLNAGHEATVHQIGNAVYTLLTHETDPAWTINDTLADAVVAECMRYDAPLHLFTRYAQETVDIGSGITLQAGEEVALLLGAANRDPHRFCDADRFIPHRDDAANVSFGAGLHFCVGAPLAKLEMRIALQTLFSRLPDLRLQQVPKYRNSFHFHGLESLHLEW